MKFIVENQQITDFKGDYEAFKARQERLAALQLQAKQPEPKEEKKEKPKREHKWFDLGFSWWAEVENCCKTTKRHSQRRVWKK